MLQMAEQINWTRGQKLWEWGFLSTYPITMFSGILLSFICVAYFWKKQKYPFEILQIMLIIIVPSSILGARFWYCVSNPDSFKNFFKFAGLSIHGGVIFSTLAVLPYIYSKRSVINLRIVLGIMMPNVLLGQVLGRWGNFANHEVYGREVSGQSLNWMGSYIKSNMYINGEYHAPFFLYESFANFIGWVLIVWVLVNKGYAKPGTGLGLYFLHYGVVRAIMEPLRTEEDIMKIGGVSTSLFVSIVLIILGVVFTTWFQFLSKPRHKMLDNKMPSKLLSIFKIEYEKVEYENNLEEMDIEKNHFGKLKYLYPKKCIIWEVKKSEEKWSKKELNAGIKRGKK